MVRFVTGWPRLDPPQPPNPGVAGLGVALLRKLADADFVVPTPLPPDAGAASVDGVVVQRWIHARQPTSVSDWKLVAAELRRLHDVFAGHRRRPGCHVATELDHTGRSVDADLSILPGDVADEVLAVFALWSDADVPVVNGDLGPSNLRVTSDGRVGTLDWTRVVSMSSITICPTSVSKASPTNDTYVPGLSDAWEAVNAWSAEPDDARTRSSVLRARRPARQLRVTVPVPETL